MNGLGLLLDWVLGVLETKEMHGIEDRGQGIAEFMGQHRQEFVLAAVKVGQRFRLLLRLPLQAAAFGDVPNVALNDASVVHLIDVADELDFDLPPVFGFERQMLVADIALLLQFSESGLTRLDISEQTDLPQFLAQELLLRVAQQSLMNGLASITFPVSASRMRMPSLAVSKSRR